MQAKAEQAPREAETAPATERWRKELEIHLCRLGSESRRNRFFVSTTDDAIHQHARNTTPAAMVSARIGGKTVGMAEIHLTTGPLPDAELALSIDDGLHSHGVGSVLFEAAIEEARALGAGRCLVYYLSTNQAMHRLAAQAGFRRVDHADPQVLCAEKHLAVPAASRPARRRRRHWWRLPRFA